MPPGPPDGSPARRLPPSARTALLIAGIPVVAAWGYLLTFGAARATPRPSDTMLTASAAAAVTALLALLILLAGGTRAKRAALLLAASLLLLLFLTLALIAQQG